MMIYIGIDPGQTGAVATACYFNHHPRRLWAVYDWPGDESSAADLLRDELKTLNDVVPSIHCFAALEDVHSMPKQGVASTFKFGTNFGIWRGILAALEIPFILVRPQQWKKRFNLNKKDKMESLYAARRQWPQLELHLKKHHGRADALWLALYARQEVKG